MNHHIRGSFPDDDGKEAVDAEPSMPSALELSGKWLCGTGAAYDLVSRDIAEKHTGVLSQVKPVDFQTANGT